MTRSGHSLRPAFEPRSVAVIGASDQPARPGGLPIAFLKQYSFAGSIFPVNPTRREVHGLPSYAHVGDIHEAIDLAVIALPGPLAPGAVAECAAAGVKVAVVLSSGFGESDPEGGKAAESRMVADARAAGMRVIGPNTQGLANFANGAVVNISSIFLSQAAADGPVGIVSQSGAMASVCYGHLRRMGIGVRHVHATGNEADVDALELAAAVCDDSNVGILLVYTEAIKCAATLVELGRRARARDLPVVMLKTARSEAGQRAAISHTGSLANKDAIVDAALRREGICRVDTIAAMVSAVPLYLRDWRRVSGRRLAVISNSGAACVMAADAATKHAMPLALLAEPTLAAARALLPGYATAGNPLDLTSTLMTNAELLTGLLPAIACDAGVDLLILGMTVAGEGYALQRFAADAAAISASSAKPLVVVASQPEVAAPFAAQGLPIFAEESEAVAVLDQLTGHRALLNAASARAPRRHARTAMGIASALDEAASLRLLDAGGVPVVPFRLCATEMEAVAAFFALGPKVVLKGCSPEIPHKTEHGLVRLGVADEAALRESYRDVAARLAALSGTATGIIVAKMIAGRREMLVGIHADPVFGLIVVVGDGGTGVEALRDVAFLVPSVTNADVREALGRLRVAPLLHGIRGEYPVDLEAFCNLVTTVSGLVEDGVIGPSDLNPVILGREGQGCTVVDALVHAPGPRA